MTKKKLDLPAVSPIEGRTVIIDTDIGSDCDDAGALAVAFRLASQYRVKIAGVCNCTSNRYGNGAIDGIASYYGYPDLTIGQYAGEHLPDSGTFSRYLSENISERFQKSTLNVSPHLDFYRRILENAGKREVILICIGQFNAVAEVLKNYPELVKEKVSYMVAMAGAFPDGREYNVYTDTKSAQYVCEHFPSPIVFSGFEVGNQLITGFSSGKTDMQAGNPVKIAYRLFEKSGRRYSWDLTAVQYAFEGCGQWYELSEKGRMIVYDDGSNTFFPSDAAEHRYLILKNMHRELEEYFDSLLADG